ncbi:DMP19 family protein [Pontibacter sp. BT731]|uniref:DMP19 family protein n=1 Tax=Pontibacter coccineus TaxID=3063328 RepID=UPI0026E46367|nr:DMP19 family protein [Pontibacter sp. BT731]MDO6388800.1 DMP19 family protein [Pontibacter sp. BT731]
MKKIFSVTLLVLGLTSLLGCNGQERKKSDVEAIDASIEAFINRTIYKELTEDILKSVPDHDLEQTVFDNIYAIIGDDYENELEKVQKLTKGQQAIFSTWMVEAEVNNGGFNQFYFNSSGQYANMAVDGFETVGAVKFAELMKEANTVYASIEKDLEKFDDGTLESFSASYKENPLNDLDDKFYKLGESESLTNLKVRYIRENIDQFITK